MPLYLIFSLRIVYPSERASLACLPAYTLLHRWMIRSMDSRFELPYLLHFKDSSASSTAVLLFQAFAICIKDRKTRLHLYIGTKPSVENVLCLFPCSLYLYAMSYVTSLEILFYISIAVIKTGCLYFSRTIIIQSKVLKHHPPGPSIGWSKRTRWSGRNRRSECFSAWSNEVRRRRPTQRVVQSCKANKEEQV